jgi:hypothetical protein
MAGISYDKLRTTTSARLVVIQPGSSDNQIRMTTVQVDLKDKPEFEAISYTWGTEVDEQTVLVNNQAAQIRHNLHAFILRLRQPHDTRVVWVDAISICQTDHKEKSQQVQMIGEIFKAASRVLAWVGEHADESEKIFTKAAAIRDDMLLGVMDRCRGISLAVDPWGSLLFAWCCFLLRPYFNRSWIVQELALARQAMIYCGTDCVALEKILYLLRAGEVMQRSKCPCQNCLWHDRAVIMLEGCRLHLWNHHTSARPASRQRYLLDHVPFQPDTVYR